jgi:hypothetical protein
MEAVKAIKQTLASPVQDGLCGHESCDCRSYSKKQQPASVLSTFPDFSPIFGGITKGQS